MEIIGRMPSKKDFAWLERQARRQLGIREMKVDPTCKYYEFRLPGCENTNLDPDGFCQICDRYHYKIAFGKMYRSGARRDSDGGCSAFGDGGQENQYGSELVLIGTNQVGSGDPAKPGIQPPTEIVPDFVMHDESHTANLPKEKEPSGQFKCIRRPDWHADCKVPLIPVGKK